MRLLPGLRPDPAGGAYSAPLDPLASFKGPLRGGEEEKEKREGEGNGKRGRGRQGAGGKERLTMNDAQLKQGRRLSKDVNNLPRLVS